jgi:hypothetical protein
MRKLIIAIMVIIALFAVFAGCTNRNNQPSGLPSTSARVSAQPSVNLIPSAPLGTLPTIKPSAGVSVGTSLPPVITVSPSVSASKKP